MRARARPTQAVEGQGTPGAREGLSGPSVTPLAGGADLWVSPAIVRERIGAWAYAHAAEAERPGAAEVRRALAVAAAVAESAHAIWRDPEETPLWEVDVAADEAELARRSRLASRDVAGALELLVRTGVVASTRNPGARSDELRLAHEVLEPAPAVAQVVWDSARARLEAAGAGAAAALAVLRELARASGPVPDATRAPFVRYSVRELEAATLFGRSTVSEALGALERARLITLDARRGQTMRCALAPAAFGHELPGPVAEAPPPPSTTVGDERSQAPAARGRGAAVPPLPAPTPASSAAPVLLGEFAGTPIYAPAGTPLVVECDAEGRWSCRVGPLLKLGPVTPPERAD